MPGYPHVFGVEPPQIQGRPGATLAAAWFPSTTVSRYRVPLDVICRQIIAPPAKMGGTWVMDELVARQ
jgi:hypothetical protein